MGAITRGIANNILASGVLDATDGIAGTIPASNINNASLTGVTSLAALSGTITKVASDPGSPTDGQVWYNTTEGNLKFYNNSVNKVVQES